MLDAIFEEFELYRHKVANDDSASSEEEEDWDAGGLLKDDAKENRNYN